MSLPGRFRNSTALTPDPGEEQPGQGFLNKLSDRLNKAINSISDRFNMASGMLNMRSVGLLTAGAFLMVTTGCGGADLSRGSAEQEILQNTRIDKDDVEKLNQALSIYEAMRIENGLIDVMEPNEDGNWIINYSVQDPEAATANDPGIYYEETLSPLGEEKTKSVKEVLQKFSKISGGKVQFVEVADSDDAKLTFRQAVMRGSRLGNCSIPPIGDGAREVVLAEDLASDQIERVVAHEAIGHGLLGANELMTDDEKMDRNLHDKTDLDFDVESLPKSLRNTHWSVMAYGQWDNDGEIFKELDLAFIDIRLPGDQGGYAKSVAAKLKEYDDNKKLLVDSKGFRVEQVSENLAKVSFKSNPQPGR